MDLGVFYEVIVPLMEMEGAATICISTPNSSFNFYSELTELRDDKGDLLFNVIKVGTVCHRCLGTERETTCNHPTGDKPDWKRETSEKMRAIYGHRTTLFMREVTGNVADAENLAFEARDLKAFFKRPPAKHPHASVAKVFVALDPNGGSGDEGGTGSQSAVVSFFYDGMNVVVRSRKTMRRRRLMGASAASTGLGGSSDVYAAPRSSTNLNTSMLRPFNMSPNNGSKYCCSK